MANSLWKAADRIISAGAEVPTAWLQGMAQGMRRTSSAKDTVAQGAAEAAAKQFDDPELAGRALARYGADILRQQANLESILRKATEDIASDPPQQDSTDEIEDDWLSRFYNEAAKTSNAEMQTYLGKILAGEIRRPGSFSIRAVLTLCMINKDTARSFEILCNMSCSLTNDDSVVIWEPFGNPGQNKMSELDAPYSMFVDLAHNELILYDFTSYVDLSEHVVRKAPFDLAGKTVWLSKSSEWKKGNIVNVKCINLTRTGIELREILSLQWNEYYVQKLKEWLNGNGVDLNLLVRRQGNKLYGTRL